MAFQTWPPQCWAEGKDPLPRPAGNVLPDAAEDSVSHLCHEGALLAHLNLVPTRTFRSCSSKLLSSWLAPLLVHGVIPPWGWASALLLQLREVPACSVLQGLRSLWKHNCVVYQPLLPVLYRRACWGVLCPIHVINEEIEWDRSQCCPHWAPTRCCATDRVWITKMNATIDNTKNNLYTTLCNKNNRTCDIKVHLTVIPVFSFSFLPLPLLETGDRNWFASAPALTWWQS